MSVASLRESQISLAIATPDSELLPAANQKVAIIVAENGLPASQLNAVVDAATPEGELRLRILENRAGIEVKPGVPITVEYARGRRILRMIAGVESSSPAAGRSEKEESSIVLLSRPLDLKRIERRRFYRIYISLPIAFKLVSFPAYFDTDPTVRKNTWATWDNEFKHLDCRGRTENLSVGGIYMATRMSLSEWTELLLEIPMPEQPLRLAGRVLWSHQARFGSTTMRRAGVEFVGITESDRDQLARFMIAEGEWRRHKLAAGQ